jgi:membrane-bound lytic murein transglycosylase B
MTLRGSRRALITLCVPLILVTACSSGAAKESSIDSTAQTQLRRDLATLAAAVAAHNTAAAQAALTALDSDAAAAHAAGKVSDAKLAQIRVAESTLQADLASSSPTPAPTTRSITASPTPSNGKDKGNGKGDGGH